MSEGAATSAGPDKFLVGITVGAVLLVVLGIAAVFVVRRAPAPAPPDLSTPAGVVQAYADALRAGEVDRAYGLLSRSAREAMPIDQFRRAATMPYRPADNERRVLIEPLREEGDAAEVRVTVSRFSAGGSPFSAQTSHQDVTVQLVREDGAWRIVRPAEPYPFL